MSAPRPVRAALVPGALTLLPAYAGQVDPVPALRRACRDAVADLVAGEPGRVVVVTSPARADNAARGAGVAAGVRIARHLLAEAGHRGGVTSDSGPVGPGDAVLVVGNGTACRGEKAPGHLDRRSFGFDDALTRTLRDRTPPPQDTLLAEELWCWDLPAFSRLHDLVAGPVDVRYEDDPYGVAYWVATWPEVRHG